MSPRDPLGSRTSRLRPPAGARRPGLYVAVAAAGAVLVGVVTGGGEPAAQAEPMASVSIAEQLGIPEGTQAAPVQEQLVPLQQLAASRSERTAAQAAAVAAQKAADREAARKAAEAAARKAAARKAAAEKAAAEKAARAEAARRAAEEQAAREEAAAAEPAAPARVAAPAPAAAAPAGSFQEYALGKLGGDAGQFSCLENLWGKESGWNPDAQNPTSTAYGIAQFLDSTWAGTGIGKTSDGYRQIDAGLIYINGRYGSPCGAWQHSQANNWY